MELDRLLAFIGVAIAVVVIPGPDMALVARNVLRYGPASGYATAVGICTGVLGWALAAALGVAALLATSAVAFTALKLAGAAYLVYLGITTLRSPDAAFMGGYPDAADIGVASAAADATVPNPWRLTFAQGVVSALLNPKLGVFFLTLLPQFISPDGSAAAQALGLAGLFEVIGLIWLVLYVRILGAARAALGRPAPRRWLRRITGTLLVGFGARVALDRS